MKGECKSLLTMWTLWFPGLQLSACELVEACSFSVFIFFTFLLVKDWCTGKLHPLGRNENLCIRQEEFHHLETCSLKVVLKNKKNINKKFIVKVRKIDASHLFLISFFFFTSYKFCPFLTPFNHGSLQTILVLSFFSIFLFALGLSAPIHHLHPLHPH